MHKCKHKPIQLNAQSFYVTASLAGQSS